MNELYSELKELCETLAKEIHNINDKVKVGDGKITVADAEYLDNITHSLASVKKTIHMLDSDMGNEEYGGYNDSYSRGDVYWGRQYNAQGRGSNANRDSMGRYRDSGMMVDLRRAMESAPSDRARRAISDAMHEIERS